MITNPYIFLKKIRQFSILDSAYLESVLDWKDVPFLVLCGDIGRSIAENFDLFSKEEKKDLFRVIEDAVSSHDNDLSIAATTGLLEAMYASAKKNPSILAKFDPWMGEETAKYLASWAAWSGKPVQ